MLRIMVRTGVVDRARRAGQWRTLALLCWGAPLSTFLLLGCGGGAPLLHPAHALPVNSVSFGAGVSGQFTSGAAEALIDRGRLAASQPLSDAAIAQGYAEGVLVHALLAPGLSPWVSARVGLPRSTEAGLTYTGRSVRLDGRHVVTLSEAWALSLGLGASAVFLSPDSPAPAPSPSQDTPTDSRAEFDLTASGGGADVPIVIGYEAVPGFLDVWAGARAGFERLEGHVRARALDPASPRTDATGQRWWGAALAGFSLGVPPLWLRFELASTFHQVTGHLTGSGSEADASPSPDFGSVEARGWTLSPSAAILGKF